MEYIVKCVSSGGWWAITVLELKGVFSQARRLEQVEELAREAIALMLDVDPNSFDIDVQPELPQEVTHARKARSELREAEKSAEEATVLAARALLAKSYTVRDAGALLRISAQRVSQLVPTAARKAQPDQSHGSAAA